MIGFISLFMGRSGSSITRARLNANPKVFFDKEALAGMAKLTVNQRVDRQKTYFNKLYTGPRYRSRDAVGFKTKFKDVPDKEHLKKFIINHNLKVIFNTRRNLVKLSVSYFTAMKLYRVHGGWNLPKTKNRTGMITIKPDKFEFRLKQAITVRNRIKSFIAGLDVPKFELYYEDILINRDSTYELLCGFLGVEYIHSESGPKKNTPDDLRLVVKNFDELKSQYIGTEYESMFDEILDPYDKGF